MVAPSVRPLWIALNVNLVTNSVKTFPPINMISINDNFVDLIWGREY